MSQIKTVIMYLVQREHRQLDEMSGQGVDVNVDVHCALYLSECCEQCRVSLCTLSELSAMFSVREMRGIR